MYKKGNDVLMSVGGQATGHATSHKLNISAETKTRKVKPVKTAAASDDDLFEDADIDKVTINGTAEGFVFDGETELSYGDLLEKVTSGTPVELAFFERSQDAAPYLKGQFLITSLEMTANSGEDVTYTAQFVNKGKPAVIDKTKIGTPAA